MTTSTEEIAVQQQEAHVPKKLKREKKSKKEKKDKTKKKSKKSHGDSKKRSAKNCNDDEVEVKTVQPEDPAAMKARIEEILSRKKRRKNENEPVSSKDDSHEAESLSTDLTTTDSDLGASGEKAPTEEPQDANQNPTHNATALTNMDAAQTEPYLEELQEKFAKLEQQKENALKYLNQWAKRGSVDAQGAVVHWKFQKLRQQWLLDHLYDLYLISNDQFDLLMEYLTSLAGKARQRCLSQAQQLMKSQSEFPSISSKPHEDSHSLTTPSTDEGKMQQRLRAQRIAELLA